MQLLASIHIVFTCSFVLLLAYALSRIFSHLARSVINGSGKARRDTDDSSRNRSRRLASIERRIEEEEEEAEVMTRLQERLQEEDEEDEYGDAQTETVGQLIAPKYEVGDSIFYDVIAAEEELRKDGLKHAASWNDEEGGMDGGMLATDRGKGESEEQEYQDNENGKVREMNKGVAGEGDASRVLSSVDQLEEEEEEEEKTASKLGDAQGSTSRLPPTWSDLERMVNMSSKNLSTPPSMSTLDEY